MNKPLFLALALAVFLTGCGSSRSFGPEVSAAAPVSDAEAARAIGALYGRERRRRPDGTFAPGPAITNVLLSECVSRSGASGIKCSALYQVNGKVASGDFVFSKTAGVWFADLTKSK